ncbi:MAG: hypothetical protein IV086_11020 [Hyphomonadaceae bacterium]|nr:hypothetical protein [Hyphomonadaceae bacterium]
MLPADFAHAQARDVAPIFGLVHAASQTAPSDALIRTLHPRHWRAGRLTAEIAPRMRAAGATPVQALSDVWGYPMDGRPAPFADMAAFSAQVRRQAELLGPDAIYSVWNEPNSGSFWGNWFPEGPTQTQDAERRLYDTYEAAYRSVESVHGQDAKIAGPSINGYDFGALRRFMEAMLVRGVRVDTLAWHDFPTTLEGVEAIEAHLREARRAFVEDPRYAAVGVRQLLIEESMANETHFAPGALIAHLYHAEAGGAAGLMRACWDEPAQGRRHATSNCWNNSLDGLLTPQGAPRAAYWAMAAYAASSQNRIGARRLAPGLYAFASRPTAGRIVVLIASARSTPIAVDLPSRLDGARVARFPLRGDGRAAMPRPAFATTPNISALELAPQEVVVLEFTGSNGREVLPE